MNNTHFSALDDPHHGKWLSFSSDWKPRRWPKWLCFQSGQTSEERMVATIAASSLEAGRPAAHETAPSFKATAKQPSTVEFAGFSHAPAADLWRELHLMLQRQPQTRYLSFTPLRLPVPTSLILWLIARSAPLSMAEFSQELLREYTLKSPHETLILSGFERKLLMEASSFFHKLWKESEAAPVPPDALIVHHSTAALRALIESVHQPDTLNYVTTDVLELAAAAYFFQLNAEVFDQKLGALLCVHFEKDHRPQIATLLDLLEKNQRSLSEKGQEQLQKWLNRDAGKEGLIKKVQLLQDHFPSLCVLASALISDLELGYFARFPLQEANLSGSPITAKGLSHFTHMPLKRLNLAGCAAIDDAALIVLHGCSLEFLDLSDCNIRGDGLLYLQHMPLKTLDLSHTPLEKEVNVQFQDCLFRYYKPKGLSLRRSYHGGEPPDQDLKIVGYRAIQEFIRSLTKSSPRFP